MSLCDVHEDYEVRYATWLAGIPRACAYAQPPTSLADPDTHPSVSDLGCFRLAARAARPKMAAPTVRCVSWMGWGLFSAVSANTRYLPSSFPHDSLVASSPPCPTITSGSLPWCSALVAPKTLGQWRWLVHAAPNTHHPPPPLPGVEWHSALRLLRRVYEDRRRLPRAVLSL